MRRFWIPTSLPDLEQLVSDGTPETATLEYKRELPQPRKIDDVHRDICALANGGGGALIYGIAEANGNAAGLCPVCLRGIVERLNQTVNTGIDEPPVIAVSTIRNEPEQGFVVVVVDAGERAPHFVDGTAYGRAGNTIKRLSRREIGMLFARSKGFSQEFGLVLERPGRIVAHGETRLLQDFGRTGFSVSRNSTHLVLENDGDVPVFDVSVEISKEVWSAVRFVEDPGFPLALVSPKAVIYLPGFVPTRSPPVIPLTVVWCDPQAREHRVQLTVSWPKY